MSNVRALVKILMERSQTGRGTKPLLAHRVAPAYMRALEDLEEKRGLSQLEIYLEASLKGDRELRQLTEKYAKTSGAAK